MPNIFDVIKPTDKIAFKVFQNRQITYKELIEEVVSKSGNFKTKDEVYGLCFPTSIDLIVDFLAVIYSGNIPVMIAHPSAKTKPEIFQERLSNAILLGVSQVFTASLSYSSCSFQRNNIAIGQLSSGTTGHQKGFLFSHEALMKQCERYSKTIDLNESSKIVSWLPLYHDMGLITSLIMPLLCGATSVLIPTFTWISNPFMFFDVLEKENGTHCWFPNFCFELLSKRKKTINTKCWFINCSEPTRTLSVEKFKEATGILNVKSCYAMAESTFACAQEIEDVVDFEGIQSSGSPIEGMEISLNENDEILIKSDFMFSEILADKKREKVDFQNQWYNTKDVGKIIDGKLFVVGRTKEMMNIAGKNIFCNQIEHCVNNIEGVHKGRCISFSLEDKGTEKCIILFEGDGVENQIREYLYQRFDIVCSIYNVKSGSLIKTSSGKIARDKNKALFMKKEKIIATIQTFLKEKNINIVLEPETKLRTSGIIDSFDTFGLLSNIIIALDIKDFDWDKNYSHLDTIEDFVVEFST